MKIIYNLRAGCPKSCFSLKKVVGIDEGVYFHHKIFMWLMRFVKGKLHVNCFDV